jgi:hypothetical protein
MQVTNDFVVAAALASDASRRALTNIADMSCMMLLCGYEIAEVFEGLHQQNHRSHIYLRCLSSLCQCALQHRGVSRQSNSFSLFSQPFSPLLGHRVLPKRNGQLSEHFLGWHVVRCVSNRFEGKPGSPRVCRFTGLDPNCGLLAVDRRVCQYSTPACGRVDHQ